LKWSQIYYRIYYRLVPATLFFRSKPILRKKLNGWSAPRYIQPSTIDGVTFEFLNVTSQFKSGDENSKLWRYNFHYHNDLNSVTADKNFPICKKMVDDWILSNQNFNGEGWEPYCISLRSVNWVKWLSRLKQGQVNPIWNDILYNQIKILEQRIEYHILGNHLFANAKAFVFAGVYFGGRQGDAWLRKGLQIMRQEMQEQFLSDGAHYELSPMYHAILLWDIADVIALHQISQLSALEKLCNENRRLFGKSFEWLNDMSHPDNDISFFNDSAFRVAPRIDDLRNYMKWLTIEPTHQPQFQNITGKLSEASGYAFINWQDVHKLIFDVAKIGPDYQPGHGHADTLSCELSLFRQRVLVNTGISTYENGYCRNNERATSSHNTVVLDDKNSSDVWDSFRVANRAEPFDIQIWSNAKRVEIRGAHDGYKNSLHQRIHERTLSAENRFLIIRDSLKGRFTKANAYWHFHPAVRVEQIDGVSFKLRLKRGQVIRFSVEGAKVNLTNTRWSCEFGLSIPNKRICLDITGTECITRFEWD
jgi:uncharacterized heparinase superfamily protein